MQFCNTSAIALHYMCLCYRRNICYSKSINYAAILSSVADLILLVVTNKQLCAILALPAPEDWWLFAADMLALVQILG
jgi:hypothetical protein